MTIKEYSETEAGLARLRSAYAGQTYEVTVPAGMRLAIAARADLRDLRVTLEKRRVEIKAPALELCRTIDTEAKRITSEIIALEDPIDVQIKAEEAKRATEREAKRLAEIAKLQAIADAQAAEERAARLAAEQAERERLDTIAAEERRVAAEKLAADRARLEAEQAAARAEAERERAVLEDERKAAAAERAAADEAARAARWESDKAAERERLRLAALAQQESERLARIEADERQARERAVAAERAELAAERARIEGAQRAERERAAAAHAAERTQYIASATLRQAAEAARDLLIGEGYAEHITTLALGAALERDRGAPTGSDCLAIAAGMGDTEPPASDTDRRYSDRWGDGPDMTTDETEGR